MSNLLFSTRFIPFRADGEHKVSSQPKRGERMKMRILYRRSQFTVDWNKPKNCQACGNDGGKHGCNCHHYKYEFKTTEVRKNPELLKKNTIWLCFPCHRVADAMRIVDESHDKAIEIRRLLDERTFQGK